MARSRAPWINACAQLFCFQSVQGPAPETHIPVGLPTSRNSAKEAPHRHASWRQKFSETPFTGCWQFRLARTVLTELYSMYTYLRGEWTCVIKSCSLVLGEHCQLFSNAGSSGQTSPVMAQRVRNKGLRIFVRPWYPVGIERVHKPVTDNECFRVSSAQPVCLVNAVIRWADELLCRLHLFWVHSLEITVANFFVHFSLFFYVFFFLLE